MSLKIAIFTSTRADYGLLYPLIVKMQNDDYFNVDLIVSGTHLSEKHGRTIDFIKKDNIKIRYEIDILNDGSFENDICQVIASGISKFSDILNKECYECIIVLGDRYELYSICIPSLMHTIPIIHFHGGEITKGAVDNSVRHSITKMASIHFPSIELYKNRIIQMGEQPDTIFAVGALGIDNICSLKLISKENLCSILSINNNCSFNIVTYHPVTLDTESDAEKQINMLLTVLCKQEYVSIITMPNADTFGDLIYRCIEKYILDFPGKLIFIKSLGQINYLSALKYANCMIGNSSSGILEAASFKLPVVNIGDRQAGRFKPDNVIDCKCEEEDITRAITKALSNEFRDSICGLENPFGQGDAADKAIEILKKIDFKNKSSLVKKDFFDIDMETIFQNH